MSLQFTFEEPSRFALYCYRLLSNQVRAAAEAALRERKASLVARPITLGELALYGYRESFEPHMWHVIERLNRKGYRFELGGFMVGEPWLQELSGSVRLTLKEKRAIESLPFAVDVTDLPPDDGLGSFGCNIVFEPPYRGLRDIVRCWNQLVHVLPDRGVAAPLVPEKEARDFLKKSPVLAQYVELLRYRLLELNHVSMCWSKQRLAKIAAIEQQLAQPADPVLHRRAMRFIDRYCQDRRPEMM